MVQRRRAGRKRRDGIERETNGRASRRASHARPIDPRETAKAQRLARGATPENALHIEHECPLGRLLISGKISRVQYEAGARFRDLDRQYRMVNGIAPPHTRAADWERGGRLLRPDTDPERVDTIRRHYMAAYTRMMAVGPAAWREIVHTVIYEREVMVLHNLIAGLDALRA